MFICLRLAKRCVAVTKKRRRCANRAKEEYGGFCKRHYKESLPPEGESFDKLKKIAKAGGGIISAAGGIIKIVEYVTANWDSIKHLIDLSHNWYFYIQQEDTIMLESKRLRIMSKAAIENEHLSEREEVNLRREFSKWFTNLPVDVKRKVHRRFGEEIISEIIDYP